MTWKGRIIGTIIGLFFGGVGAIVGFCIGYFFHDKPKNDQYKQMLEAASTFTGAGPKKYEQKHLIQSTFRLMGYVARGAGRINESHIKQSQYIMQSMNLDESLRALAIESFNEGKSDSFDLRDEAFRIRGLVGSNISMLAILLEIQVGIAIADDELSQGEHERLLNIALAMDVPVSQMERLIRVRMTERQFARYARQFYEQNQQNSTYSSSSSYGSGSSYRSDEQSNDSNESQRQNKYYQQSSKSELAMAYEILGVDANTPWEEIRRVHKKLMLKYHPDRLASQGLPPEMVKLYTQKAQDIQAAFNLIKSYHT